MVSNPPYVESADLDSLDPEVRDYEPRGALLATGVTEAIAACAPEARSWPEALWRWKSQTARLPEIAAVLETGGYEEVTATRDLAGRERIVDG